MDKLKLLFKVKFNLFSIVKLMFNMLAIPFFLVLFLDFDFSGLFNEIIVRLNLQNTELIYSNLPLILFMGKSSSSFSFLFSYALYLINIIILLYAVIYLLILIIKLVKEIFISTKIYILKKIACNSAKVFSCQSSYLLTQRILC